MNMLRWTFLVCLQSVVLTQTFLQTPSATAAELLIEAEAFDDRGGWKLDTQFIQTMGSPYLLAHGLGEPVEDATTTIQVPEAAEYSVYVRTLDWVARWAAPGKPGRFALSVNGRRLPVTFGTEGSDWHWQSGGKVRLPAGEVKLAVHDLTGFCGRVDAIYLTTEAAPPPNDSSVMSPWRRSLLGLQGDAIEKRDYDLVVVGGGYAGTAAALSAARMGCRVALIQERGVLGGNGSSEVRVWSQGLIRRGRYPRIGEIVEEFCDHATKSPGTAEEFGDELKEQIVRDEENIDLFLNHHAFQAASSDLGIESVDAFDVRSGQIRRFTAPLFADCTGHAWLGAWVNADYDQTPTGRMGMSNMWAWAERDAPQTFSETPWALPLTMRDFPYPRDYHGQWFWESGFDKDPIVDAEAIRDWNLRAVFGAFNAMKNGDGADKHERAILTWVAFIGGPRESRRLLGDVILTQDHIVEKHQFPDGCVPSTWSIDLHYPKEQYAKKFPDNPFISVAVFDRRVDRSFGYPIPYRCFYSRNIPNLFMAGRCISVTHEALGTVRVMKTCGMMGEVVGRAASVCIAKDCMPRDVYQRYWSDLDQLLRLPGLARRPTVEAAIRIPDDALEEASPYGLEGGIDPAKIQGIVVDDRDAVLQGSWTSGDGLKGYVGSGYRYATPSSGATASFKVRVQEPGQYSLQVLYGPHPNRGTAVPVQWEVDGRFVGEQRISMRGEPTTKYVEAKLADLDLRGGQTLTMTIGTEGAGGYVHVDAIRLVLIESDKPSRGKE